MPNTSTPYANFCKSQTPLTTYDSHTTRLTTHNPPPKKRKHLYPNLTKPDKQTLNSNTHTTSTQNSTQTPQSPKISHRIFIPPSFTQTSSLKIMLCMLQYQNNTIPTAHPDSFLIPHSSFLTHSSERSRHTMAITITPINPALLYLSSHTPHTSTRTRTRTSTKNQVSKQVLLASTKTNP